MATASEETSLSVIIPTLNEAAHIAGTLEGLRGETGVEVIVVDAASPDGTASRAVAAEARVILASPGRAHQMNAGAREAVGEMLFFLHGDTRAPQGYAGLIREALQRPGVAAGAFSLAIRGEGRGLRLVEALANARSRRLQLPYGDQGLFLQRRTFEAAGGFPEIPIMEDYALIRRLGRQGRIVTLPPAVTTSGRRWRRLGVWRTTGVNQMMVLGYGLGLPPGRLARWYRGAGPRPRPQAGGGGG